MSSGGIYLSGRRITDPRYRVTLDDSVEGKLIVLRKGKKHYHIIRIVGD